MKYARRVRDYSAAIALAVVLLLALLLGTYVAGYFWMGEYDFGETDEGVVEYVSRDYPQQWLADIYTTAGKVESWLRRIEVTISGPDSGRL